MPGLSDAELRQAYRSCLFSVFPSHCEGWGLPIAESLVQGKFCVASNRAPIPEVAGNLIDYFDPTDDDDALAKIERLLDPGYLVGREAALQDEYQPRTWANCVHALLAKLQQSPLAVPRPSAGPREPMKAWKSRARAPATRGEFSRRLARILSAWQPIQPERCMCPFCRLRREKSPVAVRSEIRGNSGHISKADFKFEFESLRARHSKKSMVYMPR